MSNIYIEGLGNVCSNCEEALCVCEKEKINKANTTKLTLQKRQKEEAIKRMKMLKLHENVIREFEEDGQINLSENGGCLYWLDEEQNKMVKEFEKKHNAVVYHVIHNFTEFGELYSYCYVSKHISEWKQDVADMKDGYMFVYCNNVDAEECSEFGSICFKSRIGGLVRVN